MLYGGLGSPVRWFEITARVGVRLRRVFTLWYNPPHEQNWRGAQDFFGQRFWTRAFADRAGQLRRAGRVGVARVCVPIGLASARHPDLVLYGGGGLFGAPLHPHALGATALE